MSFDAIKWAKDQKTGNPTRKLILICLASYANDLNQCYPSHKTISYFCEVERDTIINHLKQLQSLELITIEKRFETTEHNKMRQTSNLYTLNIPQYDIHTHPPVENKGASSPKKQTQINKIKNNIYTKEFLEWWNLYPRKAGSKNKAFIIWCKIVDKELSINELYNHTVRFKQTVVNTDDKYIPHATTWLNGRRWETVSEDKKAKPTLNQLVG